ncbi:major facilitator superfamily MFS_1 [Sphingobium chlorophenolicum L-1]|uniref:Major facilitator superfamily MFS_1 n=1 Tax=Sphingobium chlorophenolicum L-1 TaxID=690566 RepID=F6F3A0_SPHCR|nr:MFS transporter [Sphingobium chlorophenolicum]AEG50912.1 major facilitator superfamily MFS_1 [Sphingobium chlorophenolicum L-1]
MNLDGLDAEDGTAPTSHHLGPLTPLRRWLGVAFLSLAYMLNYVDRQMLPVLIEPIRRDIHLSDTQIGLLSGTLFAIFYTVMSIPIAAVADRVRRATVVSAACFGWSLFTGLSGMVGSFAQLAGARIAVAVGEAGGLSPSLSIVSDYFPPRLRARAVGILTAFAPLGVLIGALGGGLIAQAYGWRMAFIIPALFGMVLAPAIYFLVAEPVRGVSDNARPAPPTRSSFASVAKLFVRYPSLGLAALSGGICSVITNAAMGWTPALMMRGYGATLGDVAFYYGPVVGIGLMGGALLGGWLVSALLGRSVRAFMLVPAAAMLLCTPLFAIALTASHWPTMLALLFLPAMMMSATIPPIVAYALEVAPPNARSMTSALLMVVVNLIGIGMGPLLVGMVSDLFRPVGGDDSIRMAMLATLLPTMMLAATILYLASRHITRDRARVSSDWR